MIGKTLFCRTSLKSGTATALPAVPAAPPMAYLCTQPKLLNIILLPTNRPYAWAQTQALQESRFRGPRVIEKLTSILLIRYFAFFVVTIHVSRCLCYCTD